MNVSEISKILDKDVLEITKEEEKKLYEHKELLDKLICQIKNRHLIEELELNLERIKKYASMIKFNLSAFERNDLFF
jgi:hypothetical protein